MPMEKLEKPNASLDTEMEWTPPTSRVVEATNRHTRSLTDRPYRYDRDGRLLRSSEPTGGGLP